MGVDTVLITGRLTSEYFHVSALDALQHGFIPLAIGNACPCRHSAPHGVNRFDLHAKYAEVTDEATAQQLLAG
jgi:maleamate amidohydrolase